VSPIAEGLRRRHTVELALHLVHREFRLRYQRSALGWIWSVGNPLARLLILSFVFTKVLPLDVPNYPVFLFTGLIGWAWFSSAVTSATSSAVDRRELLFRPGVPRTVVPLVSVLSDGINYVAALPVLALFLVFSTGIPLTALALPLVLAPMVVLALGLGFALCAANVYVRDVRIVVELVMLLGFYLSPVFYSRANVPTAQGWLLDVNPMAWALDSQRRVLVEGRLPDPATFGLLVAAATVALAVGLAVYRRASRTFVDEL
jgi:lipopolysaccharide transport system permease protein